MDKSFYFWWAGGEVGLTRQAATLLYVVGSNPSLFSKCGISIMVIMSSFQVEDAGSIPAYHSK